MNAIEENEDGAVRGLLGTVFAAAEPPPRDLASGSIARGDAARRRTRLFTAGGAVLSAAAVAGTFAVVNGAGPAPKHGLPAATPTTSAPDIPGSAHGLPSVAEMQDLEARMPALLQPLMPQGVTVTAASRDYGPSTGRPRFLLTGPTGTTTAEVWLETAPPNRADDQRIGCLEEGSCETKQVPGGTIYKNWKDLTAAELAGAAAAGLKPGTANTKAGTYAILSFFPADRTKPVFAITETTQTAALQYSDQEPAAYRQAGSPWPPVQYPSKYPLDPAGLRLSVDDFAAIVANPGLNEVEKELQPGHPISQDTLKLVADRISQVGAAGATVLPPGLKLTLDVADTPRLRLAGATGSNDLSWQTQKQDPAFLKQVLLCPPNVECTTRPVAGGKLLTWVEYPTDSKLNKISTTPSAYHYTFIPADTGKPAVTVTLGTGQAASGDISPLQLTAEQFLTIAANPRLQAAIDTTTAVVAGLQ